jgi:hypothetical protein
MLDKRTRHALAREFFFPSTFGVRVCVCVCVRFLRAPSTKRKLFCQELCQSESPKSWRDARADAETLVQVCAAPARPSSAHNPLVAKSTPISFFLYKDVQSGACPFSQGVVQENVAYDTRDEQHPRPTELQRLSTTARHGRHDKSMRSLGQCWQWWRLGTDDVERRYVGAGRRRSAFDLTVQIKFR